ncbi:MAG: spermidine/putrescine ABC transporter substrate-binding protein [Myxococcales bacterium]
MCYAFGAMLTRRDLLQLLALAPLAAAGCRRTRALNLYNWGDYLAPEVVARFVEQEEARGERVDVRQDYFLGELEMVSRLSAGARYDAVFVIDYLLSRMQREGLLAPLELAALPGLAHLDPAFPAWRAKEKRGGKTFAVPYLWGVTGIGYDAEKVQEAPTSWKALFDPRYAGRISVLDSKGDVFDQALLASGLDINSRDKVALRERVYPMLQAQRKLLRAYDADPVRALVAGETWLAQVDNGDLLRAQAQRPTLRFVIPEEGAAQWVDYLTVPARSSEPQLAHRFLQHLLDPEVAALNANHLRFATPNRAALASGKVRDAGDPQVYPDEATRTRLFRSQDWQGGTGALVEELWLELRSR